MLKIALQMWYKYVHVCYRDNYYASIDFAIMWSDTRLRVLRLNQLS